MDESKSMKNVSYAGYDLKIQMVLELVVPIIVELNAKKVKKKKMTNTKY